MHKWSEYNSCTAHFPLIKPQPYAIQQVSRAAVKDLPKKDDKTAEHVSQRFFGISSLKAKCSMHLLHHYVMWEVLKVTFLLCIFAVLFKISYCIICKTYTYTLEIGFARKLVLWITKKQISLVERIAFCNSALKDSWLLFIYT